MVGDKMAMRRRPSIWPLPLVMVALVATACSRGTPSTVHVTAGSVASRSQSLSRPLSSSSGSTGMPISPACKASSLSLTSKPLGAGAGNSYLGFIIINRGPAACSVGGTPKATVANSSHLALYSPPQTVSDIATSSGVPSASVPEKVNLAPGGLASFWIDFLPCNGPPAPTRLAHQGYLEFAMSGVAGFAEVPFMVNRGCASQQLTVSPVVAGTVSMAPGYVTGGSPPVTVEAPPVKSGRASP